MTGGGIINRKPISILSLLFIIAISLNVGVISATITTIQPNINQDILQNPTTNTASVNYKTMNTFSTKSTTFTIANINSAASNIMAYVEANHKLPDYITISGVKVTMPQFLNLLTEAILKINSGSKTAITLKSISKPDITGVESINSGKIQKNEYINIVTNVNNFINKYQRVPATASTSLGKIRYEALIYTFSKITDFYDKNKRLPKYVSSYPGIITYEGSSNTTIPSDIKPYLNPTKNCQSDNSILKSKAISITKGLKTQKAKAIAIFNWVRNNINYSFYYNTKYGALGTYNSRYGNCVDTSHLLIALERAAGVPARYEKVYARFTSGHWYGHVLAQIYVEGVWYRADGTSSRNQFGVINNWNTDTATYYGTYRELPF
ncbi:MAG: transglutaminase family protein [Methanobacterium sp.]|nr:transglutaminase family protein [Methanobacterium sp.]